MNTQQLSLRRFSLRHELSIMDKYRYILREMHYEKADTSLIYDNLFI